MEAETLWEGREGLHFNQRKSAFCLLCTNILSMISFEETILLSNIVEKHCEIPFDSFHHRMYYLFPSYHLTYCTHYQKTMKQFWTFCLEPSVCIILPIQMPFFLIIRLKTSWNFYWKTRRQQMNTMRPHSVRVIPYYLSVGSRPQRKDSTAVPLPCNFTRGQPQSENVRWETPEIHNL